MAPVVQLSRERDIPLLQFLWKWKVATTRALTERFFQSCTPEVAYRRILGLNRAGFIKGRCSDTGNKFVWLLTSKGFQIVKPHLPPLQEAGYASEHVGHDLLVAAIHIGDWLRKEPENVELISEQELRRYSSEEHPGYVPVGEDDRRPDGYWDIHLGGERRLVALEVELHRKARSDYELIGDFYNRSTTINAVLWVVPNSSMAQAILKVFGSFPFGGKNIHSFVLFQDFLRAGWHATIRHGALSGNNIFQLLRFTPNRNPIAGSSHAEIPSLLQTQKSYRNSSGLRVFNLEDFC